MSLERLLTKDRKEFDKIAQEENYHIQSTGLIVLLSKIVDYYAHVQGQDDELSARVDAFIKMALAADISPYTCERVLTIVNAFTRLRDGENYTALKAICDEDRRRVLGGASPIPSIPKPPVNQHLETDARKARELNMHFLALRGTVDEYNDWLDSLKGRTRPLSRDDYTIRDSILKRMKEQATPYVIGKLLEAIGK